MGKRKQLTYYPLLPTCLDVTTVWEHLRGRKPASTQSNDQLRKSLQLFLRKGNGNLSNYSMLLIYLGKEVQNAVDDLSTRRRVALGSLYRYISDPYLRNNVYYLNTAYLSDSEVTKVLHTLTDMKRAITIHICDLNVSMLNGYVDTYVESR